MLSTENTLFAIGIAKALETRYSFGISPFFLKIISNYSARIQSCIAAC